MRTQFALVEPFSRQQVPKRSGVAPMVCSDIELEVAQLSIRAPGSDPA